MWIETRSKFYIDDEETQTEIGALVFDTDRVEMYNDTEDGYTTIVFYGIRYTIAIKYRKFHELMLKNKEVIKIVE